MKHLFNDISSEEKNRILEMHKRAVDSEMIYENQSQDMGKNENLKIKEFVDVFKPLGSMWTQNKFDNTSYLSPSIEVGISDRLSFIQKSRPEIKCKLKRDGNTIECQDKNGIIKFNLTTEFVKFKKWISNYEH
jgi:hypothetical protein